MSHYYAKNNAGTMPTALSFVFRWTLRTTISPLYKIRAKLVFFKTQVLRMEEDVKWKHSWNNQPTPSFFSFVFSFGCLFFVCFQGLLADVFREIFSISSQGNRGNYFKCCWRCLSFKQRGICTHNAKNNIDSHSQVA